MVRSEADILGTYLVGHAPTAEQARRYGNAAGTSQPAEATVTVLSKPGLIPYVDAHDAFFRPSSDLRRRLYLLFSILEASKEDVALFLPKKTGLLPVIGYGLRAIWRLVIGTIIVRLRSI